MKEIGQIAWEAYCQSVGGIASHASSGDKLPSWEAMIADHTRVKMVKAWRNAAAAVADVAVSNYLAMEE